MGQADDVYLRLLQVRYRHAGKKEKIRHQRRARYGAEEADALAFLAALFDDICSKRLRVALDVELPRLYQAGTLRISATSYQNLLKVSPASMDRLRVRYHPLPGKRRGFTKPGTLLKQRIPVRTWADWSEDRPGFCEVDLVDHSGGQIVRGRQHAWTLCLTDVKTGWTESVAVRNKTQVHVFAAIRQARQRLPFPLLGIDSDSGSEFINDQLYRYCLRERITFTRGRAGRRNDNNAYVEQKNWSVVRRAVGYSRYDQPDHLEVVEALYARLHYYFNFFLPVMKLQDKVRLGSKVVRIHDEPQTPSARVLASPTVSEADKAELREAYGYLDLVELRRRIDDLQVQLLRAMDRAGRANPSSGPIRSA